MITQNTNSGKIVEKWEKWNREVRNMSGRRKTADKCGWKLQEKGTIKSEEKGKMEAQCGSLGGKADV